MLSLSFDFLYIYIVLLSIWSLCTWILTLRLLGSSSGSTSLLRSLKSPQWIRLVNSVEITWITLHSTRIFSLWNNHTLYIVFLLNHVSTLLSRHLIIHGVGTRSHIASRSLWRLSRVELWVNTLHNETVVILSRDFIIY